MGRGNRVIACLFGVVMALQLGVTTPAQACAPQIEAYAWCDTSTYELYITYRSYEWQGNSQIDVLFNDVKVASDAYTETNGYSFGGTKPYPETTGDVVVMTKAIGFWEDGHEPGQTMSITVPYPTEPCEPQGTGRFTGGGHQVKVDQVRVTRGLTLHCDLLLSNNLEVNWTGNQFHMTEHLQTVACTDSPLIDQFPPAAPLDTLIGVGTGRYNGEDGYTIEFTLVDAGEPGRSDQMQILIYESANPGNVVLDVPLQVLTGGNLQAHYDQPHK